MMGKNEDSQSVSYDPLLEKAAEFYQRTLQREGEGFESLRRHGITEPDFVERFGIGYCDGRLLKVLPSEPKARDRLLTLGILEESTVETDETLREYLLDCLVFPLHDLEGGLVGLYGLPVDGGSGRLLPSGPAIWNLPAAGNFPTLMVANDLYDALSLHVAGYANTIAILSDTFEDQDIDVLEQAGVQQVHLVFPDPPTPAVMECFGSVACIHRKVPKPVNAILCDKGAEELAAILEAAPRQELVTPSPSGAMEIMEGGFAVVLGPRRYEIRGLDKSRLRLKATIRVEHAGRLHVDSVDLYSARNRRSLCRDLCGVFNEASHVIESDVTRILLISEAHDPNQGESVSPQNVDPARLMSAGERREAETFGRTPDLIQQILEDYRTCGLIGEESNKLLYYLAAVSRKTDHPLSVLILSSSGAGKSMLQDTTLSLCSPEDVVKLTSLTGKALFYKGRHSIKHKVLALEEEAGADQADYAIRNLISAGELIIETTIKDSGTGRLTTMENRVEGPTSVFFTTTNPEVDPETRSRFFVTSVDESREQTRAILASQRQRHAQIRESQSGETAAVRRRHHNFQRLLKPIPVVNPFAERLDYLDDRLQSRRDQPKVLNLIRSVAFLRQMTKPIKTRKRKGNDLDYIEVDETDLSIGCELASKVLCHSLDDLNQVSRDLLVHLERMVTAQVMTHSDDEPIRKTDVEFTRRDIRAYTGWSHVRVHKYIQQLVELEYVYRVQGSPRVRHHYRLALDDLQSALPRSPLGVRTDSAPKEPQ